MSEAFERVPVPAEQVVAANIKAWRRAAGLTQGDLAGEMAALGWHWYKQTVGRVERNERKVRIGELVDLAAVFGVTAAELLGCLHAYPRESGHSYNVPANGDNFRKPMHVTLAGPAPRRRARCTDERASIAMPFLDFIRHAIWLTCGITGALSWVCFAALIVRVLGARRKRPALMSDAEFEAEVAEILRGAR